MNRIQLEHVIAAAADVSGEREIVVIGSQAILGTADEPPASMLLSMEADIYPRNAPEKSIDIDGSLGDGSPFHGFNGYFAHGVGPGTVRAPEGWEDRLVRVEIPPRVGQRDGAIAFCLEVHDLILAKCVRGEDRDWDFARDALSAGLVQIEELLARTDDLPVPASDHEHIREMLVGIDRRLDRRKG
jgi:hypothetical protein